MNTVAYSSPFVPPEWIAAHGLAPERLIPPPALEADSRREGVCPFAQAVSAECRAGRGRLALVIAATCDQMRRSGQVLADEGLRPVFLMNVPATWQSPSAAAMYAGEVARFGKFLERLGGTRPDNETLSRVMMEYEQSRRAILNARPALSARRFEEELISLPRSAAGGERSAPELPAAGRRSAAIPIAILGGPLARDDMAILDLVESSGGRVVLDATENGERALPAPLDVRRLDDDPSAELARMYFEGVVDAFRRPDSALHAWLDRMIAERSPKGLILLRQVWCDLWHAEAGRIRQRLSIPVLDVDVSGGRGVPASVATRIQSFLEVLA